MEKISKILIAKINDKELNQKLGIKKGKLISIQPTEDNEWIIQIEKPIMEVPDELPELDIKDKLKVNEQKLKDVEQAELEELKKEKEDLLAELRENKQVPMRAEELKEVKSQDDDLDDDDDEF